MKREILWLRDVYVEYEHTDGYRTYGFTLDETHAWSTILARLMGHVNYRRFVGFRFLKGKKAKCKFCGRPAKIALIFTLYHEVDFRNPKGNVYSISICPECFDKMFSKIEAEVSKIVKQVRERILNEVEENDKVQGNP